MARAFKFILVPENTDDVVDYVVIEGEYEEEVNEDLEASPEEFFHELIDDRYPGYVYQSHEEVPVSLAKENNPFEL